MSNRDRGGRSLLEVIMGDNPRSAEESERVNGWEPQMGILTVEKRVGKFGEAVVIADEDGKTVGVFNLPRLTEGSRFYGFAMEDGVLFIGPNIDI